MKLTMTDNPVVHAKKRYWMLEKRKRNLGKIATPGWINYNDQGMASSFVINTDPRSRKAQRLRSRIRKEQQKIARWLHRNGYNLA